MTGELLFELAQMGVTFVLCWLTVAIGAARERGRRPKPVSVDRLNLRCGCQHELSYHDGLGGCGYGDQKLVYNKTGKPMTQDGEYIYRTEPCRCQQYTGDLPADWFSRDSLRELAPMIRVPEAEVASVETDGKGA